MMRQFNFIYVQVVLILIFRPNDQVLNCNEDQTPNHLKLLNLSLKTIDINRTNAGLIVCSGVYILSIYMNVISLLLNEHLCVGFIEVKESVEFVISLSSRCAS